jgi:hypothetical protein
MGTHRSVGRLPHQHHAAAGLCLWIRRKVQFCPSLCCHWGHWEFHLMLWASCFILHLPIHRFHGWPPSLFLRAKHAHSAVPGGQETKIAVGRENDEFMSCKVRHIWSVGNRCNVIFQHFFAKWRMHIEGWENPETRSETECENRLLLQSE